MQNIIPTLWFADNNCAEAVRYYLTVFPDSAVHFWQYYPEDVPDPHFDGMQGKVLTVSFKLRGIEFMALDGGPIFRMSEAVSFTITCADQQEIDYYTEHLSHVPESAVCGWVKDRFGVSWQIVPEKMQELMQTPAQIEAMMSMKKIMIADLEAAGQVGQGAEST